MKAQQREHTLAGLRELLREKLAERKLVAGTDEEMLHHDIDALRRSIVVVESERIE